MSSSEASSSSSAASRPTYIPELDGLRGCAVLMVLLAHSPAVQGLRVFNYIREAFARGGAGYIGVEVFFVLSGFLITRILVHDSSSNPLKLKHFYTKRVFRILPVFAATLIGSSLAFPQFDYLPVWLVYSNYWFSFNFEPHPLRHFWSLAVEEQFYLLWPILVIYLSNRQRSKQFLVGFLLITSVTIVVLRDFASGTPVAEALIYRSLETRMLALVLGSAFALFGTPRLRPSIYAAAILISYSFVLAARVLNRLTEISFVATAEATGYCVVAIGLFLLALDAPSISSRFLRNPILKSAGKISYGLYAYHLPIYFWFGVSHMRCTIDPVPAHAFLGAVSCTYVATIASWLLLEKPLLRASHRFVRSQ